MCRSMHLLKNHIVSRRNCQCTVSIMHEMKGKCNLRCLEMEVAFMQMFIGQLEENCNMDLMVLFHDLLGLDSALSASMIHHSKGDHVHPQSSHHQIFSRIGTKFHPSSHTSSRICVRPIRVFYRILRNLRKANFLLLSDISYLQLKRILLHSLFFAIRNVTSQ